MKKIIVITLFFLIVNIEGVLAQCAMCRSTLENNFSNGNPGIAAGINTGILYLLAIPYLAILTLGFFWYKNSSNARKEFNKRVA